MSAYLKYLAMLNPSIENYQFSSTEIFSSNNDAFSWCDVCGALARLNKNKQLLLLFKGTADRTVVKELADFLIEDLLNKFEPKWKVKQYEYKPKRLSRLAITALIEWAQPPICTNCNGYPNRYEKITGEVCFRCHGIGVTRFTIEIRAAGIGVSESAYSKTWRERYEEFLQYIYDLESIGNTQLLDYLGKEYDAR